MWEGKTNGCVGTSYYKFQWITLSTQKKGTQKQMKKI